MKNKLIIGLIALLGLSGGGYYLSQPSVEPCQFPTDGTEFTASFDTLNCSTNPPSRFFEILFALRSLSFGSTAKVTFDPTKAQVVQWDKPKTDAEWAEDVKKESFDIKSTGKLTEMRDVHQAKLLRVQAGKKEVFECRACIDFKYKESNPAATQAEIDANYADELAKANWEVEKLKQSVERMENELRLRDKGFVVVEGEETGLLGGLTKPYAIRVPND